MKQKGFVLSPTILAAAGTALVIVSLGAALMVQTARLDAVKDEYAQFKGGVAAIGEAEKAKNAKIELDNLKAKERHDEESARTHAADRATISKLRHERDSARRSIVPAAPAAAKRPDLACFDRAELESAFRDFIADVRGQADECTKATIDLNTAKRWAQGK